MKEIDDVLMKFLKTKYQTEYIIIFKNDKTPSLKLFVDIQKDKKDEDIIKNYIISEYGDIEYNAIRIDELKSVRLKPNWI